MVEVLETGLSVQVEMKGLKLRSRRGSSADVKPFFLFGQYTCVIISEMSLHNVPGNLISDCLYLLIWNPSIKPW